MGREEEEKIPQDPARAVNPILGKSEKLTHLRAPAAKRVKILTPTPLHTSDFTIIGTPHTFMVANLTFKVFF